MKPRVRPQRISVRPQIDMTEHSFKETEGSFRISKICILNWVSKTPKCIAPQQIHKMLLVERGLYQRKEGYVFCIMD